jgi:ribosomal protein L21
MSLQELRELKAEHKKVQKENQETLEAIELRRWLKVKNKDHFLDFDEQYRQKIKDYFDSMDEDGSGAIGIDELEDALLTLGMAKSRVQVQKLMDLVDEDGSGQIEFGEFLTILKGPSQIYGSKLDEQSKINQSIMKFFKGKSVSYRYGRRETRR